MHACAVYAIVTSSFTRFGRSATSPLLPTVSNPAPDSSLCRAAAPRLHQLQMLLPDGVRFHCSSPLASASGGTPRLCTLQLLLATCIHFSCCSLLRPLQLLPVRPLKLLLPDRNCSPIASASTAASRSCPLQLLLARLRPL